MTSREGIYVIYRPLPATMLTLVLALVGGLLGLTLGSAVGAALGQRDPGPGVWDTSNTTTHTGVLVAEPYPMLLPDDASAAVLLVGVGKMGPPADVLALAGDRVTITGYPLERDGLRMLEVQSGQSLSGVGGAGVSGGPRMRLAPIDRGVHTIDTEILDAKCYLGAMKPGDGLGHKACATLCIAGGIPPMVRWHDEDGRSHYAILTSADGAPMAEAHRALIGEPVAVRGRVTSQHGWLWLDVQAIERR